MAKVTFRHPCLALLLFTCLTITIVTGRNALSDEALHKHSHDAAAADTLAQLLQDYASESKVLSHEEQDAQWFITWRSRLLDGARHHPKSPFRMNALTQALAMSNTLNDYEVSESIALELANSTNERSEKARWYCELGEIVREMTKIAVGKGEKDKARTLAAKSIKYFRKVSQLLDSVPPEKLTTDLRDIVLMTKSYRGELERNILHDNAAASKSYAEALETAKRFNEIKPEEKDKRISNAVGFGHDGEHFASQLMDTSISTDNMSAAEEALDYLAEKKDGRHPPSHYALAYANKAFPQGGEAFQKHLEGWLKKKPDDGYTPVLLFYLARDYYQNESYDNAMRLYELLRGQYLEQILQLDKTALDKGQGGYIAEILDHSARILQGQGKLSDSKAIIEEMKHIVPTDHRRESLEGLQASAEAKAKKALQANKEISQLRRSLPRRLMLIVSSIMLLLAIGFFYIRRHRKTQLKNKRDSIT